MSEKESNHSGSDDKHNNLNKDQYLKNKDSYMSMGGGDTSQYNGRINQTEELKESLLQKESQDEGTPI